MRSRPVSKVVFAGSILAALSLPGRGEADCPTPEFLCWYYPPIIPIVEGMACTATGANCQDDDCVAGVDAEAVFVSSSTDEEDLLLDDSDLYTTRWLVRHEDEMVNLSCAEAIEHPHGSFLIMPEQKHCAVALPVGDLYYLEFFASSPDGECHGWGECRCEEVDDPPQKLRGPKK